MSLTLGMTLGQVRLTPLFAYKRNSGLGSRVREARRRAGSDSQVHCRWPLMTFNDP